MFGLKNLKNNLSYGLVNFYYIYGDDILLYDKAVNMIKKACNITMPDFNIQIFDDDNFDMNNVISACKNLPLLDNKKLIILKNLTKIDEKSVKQLKKYVEKCEKHAILICLDYFAKFESLKCLGQEVNCNRLDRKTLLGVLLNDAKRQNIQITSENLIKVVDMCNGYYSIANNELFKLGSIAYGGQVTASMIQDNITTNIEYSVFELTDALGKKDGQKAVEIMLRVEQDSKLFPTIINTFRRMFFISICDKSDDELAKILGVKEYSIVVARRLSKNFSKIQLKNIHDLLEEIDFKTKNGDFSQKNYLFYLVFAILNI